MDYHANKDWLYSGDVNASYGGVWIKHCGGYAEAVRIEDLDSGCGFTGAVLIERCSVGLYTRSLKEAKERIQQALDCYGWTIADVAMFGRDGRRAATWEAMLSYGFGDCDTLETLQLEPDGPMKFDGWRADRKQTGGDIGGYIMAKYLD